MTGPPEIDDDPFPDDDPLIEFLETARIVRFRVDDAILAVGDMELLYTVTAGDGGLVVARSSRGGRPRTLLTTPHVEVVRRFLVVEFGPSVRWARGLSALARADGATVSVTEDDDGARLRWVESGRTMTALFPRPIDAHRFASYVDRPEEHLMRRFDPTRPGGPMTEDELVRLAGIGRARVAAAVGVERLDESTTRAFELPGATGVGVAHTVRGGAKAYVARDGSALVVGSAVDHEAALTRFRSGERNA